MIRADKRREFLYCGHRCASNRRLYCYFLHFPCENANYEKKTQNSGFSYKHYLVQ
uniref:Uncharacterized protein n=1 Tax=Siphoviridae sp. ctcMb1 TaxID=2827276 RepID=A0A8S5R5F4_9CAUD|nr:MAG TPA: hypothetical protein [Siphoviridae sp. ctcMb1]DAW50549.1 MAG TPA: hypothetical protein [Caudoviricetes sp.]